MTTSRIASLMLLQMQLFWQRSKVCFSMTWSWLVKLSSTKLNRIGRQSSLGILWTTFKPDMLRLFGLLKQIELQDLLSSLCRDRTDMFTQEVFQTIDCKMNWLSYSQKLMWSSWIWSSFHHICLFLIHSSISKIIFRMTAMFTFTIKLNRESWKYLKSMLYRFSIWLDKEHDR